ncbi:MAG: MFS transporter permease [Actinobacteria bacterium]|nr:MFS transporter permease [Actinomycetota bacterium]
MWVRRAFYGWMIPAALVLPLWLFVGWGVFNAGGWAFLWVLFIAIPSVFLGQLVLTLLVRARGTVRAQRAVSWWDVLGFGLWHGLTIACGFYNPAWFAPVMVSAVIVGLALFWLTLWQLWREARPSAVLLRTSEGVGFIPAPAMPQTPRRSPADDHEVIVIAERQPPAS